MVEPSVNIIPNPNEHQNHYPAESLEEHISCDEELEKSLSSRSFVSTHGPFKINPISSSRRVSSKIEESYPGFGCSEKSENIIALIWGALILFMGVIFVVAEFNTHLKKYSFTTTYWVLFTFMLISVVGMLIAILNRKNEYFIYKEISDDDIDSNGERDTSYLLYAAYIFSTGNFMLDMFSILTVLHCGVGESAIAERSRYAAISAFHILRIMFIGAQLTFLEIFMNEKIRRSYQLPFKLLLAQVIATNFTVWFTFLCQETGIMSGSSNGPMGEYDILNCTSTPNNGVFKIAKYASTYLTPFILEFNLLSGALFYSLFPFKTFNYEELDDNRKYNYGAIDPVKRDNSKIYRSQPALLIGILIGLLLVLSACGLYDSTHYIYNLKLNYAMQILVHVVIMATTFMLLFEMRRFHTKKYLRMNYRIDDYLLMFTGIGGFLPFLFMVLFSVLKYKENEVLETANSDNAAYQPVMRALLGVMAVMNAGSVLTQTFILLIARSYKRVAFSCKASDSFSDLPEVQENYSKLRSTARIGQWLLLLLVLNASMWVIASTFEISSTLNHAYLVTTVYWSKKVWLFVTSLLYPFLMFYRIHSAAMIANIWMNFRLKKKML